MKSYIYYFILILMVFFNGCCDDCGVPCSQSFSAYEIAFFCYVFDKETNESIVGHCLDCPYSNTVSTLVDMNGDTVRTERTIDTDGAMTFFLIKHGRDSVNYPIHQEYYLHLVDFDNVERDVDTISFDFTLVHSDRCELYDYKDFRCYYNDSLYLTEYKWHKEGGRVFFYK